MFKKINRKNKKGFTLAELLIVVAIIGVLVAISIPIFTAQLEKSREATDAANVRAAYAEAAAKQIDGTISSTATVVTIKASDTTYSAIGNPTIGDKKMSELGFATGNSYTISVSDSGAVGVTKK